LLLNPLPHGPLCPPLSHGPWADLPYKNRADLPEGRELRATVIAALSLRVSLLNNFFFLILWNAISIWNSYVITMEQWINNLFAYKLFNLETL
jgi:hypothetical protein